MSGSWYSTHFPSHFVPANALSPSEIMWSHKSRMLVCLARTRRRMPSMPILFFFAPSPSRNFGEPSSSNRSDLFRTIHLPVMGSYGRDGRFQQCWIACRISRSNRPTETTVDEYCSGSSKKGLPSTIAHPNSPHACGLNLPDLRSTRGSVSPSSRSISPSSSTG